MESIFDLDLFFQMLRGFIFYFIFPIFKKMLFFCKMKEVLLDLL